RGAVVADAHLHAPRRAAAVRGTPRARRAQRRVSRHELDGSPPRRAATGGPAMNPHVDRRALALRVREHVIRMTRGGGCFLGASLPGTDLLVPLSARVLRPAPTMVDDPDRDSLLLSKGHAVPALYGTLAELGWFPPARLARHLDPDDSLYWHP